MKWLSIISAFSLFALSCGFNIQPRIIDGDLGDPADFPFYVQIVDRNESVCGGTLISDRWIVTAAHCIRDKDYVVVCLGSKSNGKFESSNIIPPWYQFVHPLHSGRSANHDIGLIQLILPMRLSRLIQPVQLTTSCEIPHLGGRSVIAAGMGRINTKQSIPLSERRLRQAHFETISSQVCSNNVRHPNPQMIVCTEANDRGQSGAPGDSGGPLVLTNDRSLLGVTSIGILYQNGTVRYQFFTHVPYYYEWITHVTGIETPKCNGPQAQSVFEENLG